MSSVHPRYKTKYRVANWASYDRALVGRGDIGHGSRALWHKEHGGLGP